jgi:hypothetical protein
MQRVAAAVTDVAAVLATTRYDTGDGFAFWTTDARAFGGVADPTWVLRRAGVAAIERAAAIIADFAAELGAAISRTRALLAIGATDAHVSRAAPTCLTGVSAIDAASAVIADRAAILYAPASVAGRGCAHARRAHANVLLANPAGLQ